MTASQENLIDAATRGQCPRLKALLTNGVPVDGLDRGLETALTRAAAAGQTEAVKMLLEYGADINKRVTPKEPMGLQSVTALHIATVRNRSHVVEMLIKHGANVNSPDARGSTPLHYACRDGYEYLTTLFYNNGADLDATDIDGDTPLHFASMEGKLGTVKLLLGWGADPSITNMWENTCLDMADIGECEETHRYLKSFFAKRRLVSELERKSENIEI